MYFAWPRAAQLLDGIGARDSAAGQVRARAGTTTAGGVGKRDPAISWSNGTPIDFFFIFFKN
jgi:hypothetical protein